MKLTKIFLPISLLVGSFGLMSMADNYFQISKNLDVFSALYKEIHTSYVDETDPSKLMRTCIDGMLKTLDPFTNYISESQIENYRLQNSEKLTGFGVHFEMHNQIPVITEVMPDLPAAKAGLKVGDKIIAIDGKMMEGHKEEEVSLAMRGQAGTAVSLGIINTHGESKILNITRQEFQETNVPFYGMISENIGLINLKIFNQNASKDVKESFEKLKKENPKMTGLILDLRANPGGLLNEAVNIVNLFVAKNELVVTTKGKVDEWNSTFKTLNEPVDTKIPLVMLTDNKSASASEIVSGCMQDYDRGVVLGQKTYGKGLVQVTKNLSYNTMLKVTTAKYYIPSGRCIQALLYAEKNEDGSVKRIPDSLKHEFKTLAGRKVWDGGGIDPDIPMPKKESHTLIDTLQKKHILFDFATKFQNEHDTILPPSKFHLSDKDFADFIAFAKQKGYNYQTKSERILVDIKKAAEEENYLAALKEHLKILENRLSHSENDLLEFKDEITTLLENEICGRYFSQHGKIEKSLQNDPFAKKAMLILNSPQEYKDILSAKK